VDKGKKQSVLVKLFVFWLSKEVPNRKGRKKYWCSWRMAGIVGGVSLISREAETTGE